MDPELPPDDSEPQALQWTDAQGQAWTLQPSTELLILSRPGEEAILRQAEWDSRIDYNEVGGRIVFRFDVHDRQVGFMVSGVQGEQLLARLGWTNERGRASAARLQAQTQRSYTWPTVTTWSIVALFAAALSFLPVIGAAFAVLAIAGLVISVLKAKANTRLVHTPAFVAATLAILIIATTAQALSLLLLFGPALTEAGSAVGGMARDLTLVSKVIAVIVVLLSLSVHEAAHALAAWWCGDDGPLQRGRVTLNPIAHIDPLGTILVPAVLAFSGGAVFGWAKPVMVSLHGVPNPRRANLLISGAGPLSNFLLGLIFLSLYLILGCCIRLLAPEAAVTHFSEPFGVVSIRGFAAAPYVAMVTVCLKWGFFINLLLFFFNMIPLPPLDGGHILASLFPATVGEFYRKLGPFALLIFLGLIVTGLIWELLRPGMDVIYLGFALVRGVTGL